MKNLNPLYEFEIFKYGLDDPKRIKWMTDVATSDVADYAKKHRLNPFGSDYDKERIDWAKNHAAYKLFKDRDVNTKIGSTLGGLAGGAGGAFLSTKLLKNKERTAIKNIILQSDSPEDCIEKLKEIGTRKALKYCDIVNKVSKDKPYGWKGAIANSINIKNIGGPAVGGVVGAYIGNRIGHGVVQNSGISSEDLSNNTRLALTKAGFDLK